MSALAAIAVPPTAGYTTLHLVAHRTSAVSDETGMVRDAARRVADFGERSVALFGRKQAAISDIWALVHESREVGEDVEDAQPISAVTAERAADFIRALPDNVPLPECAWDPD